MTHLLIISSQCAIDHMMINEGISERNIGLYGTLARHWKEDFKQSKVFWYSCRDSCLYEIEKGGIKCVKRMPILFGLFWVFKNTSQRFPVPYLAIVIGYPHGLFEGLRKLEFFFLTLFLRVLKLLNMALVVTDVVDSPLEAAVAFGYRVRARTRVQFHTCDILALKGNVVITTTQSYKNYLVKKYRLPKQKVYVIANGSLVNYISSVPAKLHGQLNVLYSGSLIPQKDISKLVTSIDNLRKKDYDIKLVLAGKKFISIESYSWLKHALPGNWLVWVRQFLERADVCVVPYPKRFHFNYTSLAKLANYMAAGKAIVSMDLTETSRVLRNHNCGLIAHDWNEFESHIKRLYNNRELAVTLGMNARKVAENEYNVDRLARKFQKIILDNLRGCLR